MRVVFGLVFLANACGALSINTAFKEDPAKVLATLLATSQQPTAISNVQTFPQISGKRRRPFYFDRGGPSGSRIEMPLRFDGQYVSSSFETTWKGIKLAFPFGALINELYRFRFKPSDIEGELEYPIRFEVNGVPVKVPVDFASNKVSFPVMFNTSGVEWKIPLSSALEEDGVMSPHGFEPSQISAKLQYPLRFDFIGHDLTIPVKYKNGRLSGELEWRVRGTVITLPVSFLLGKLSRLSQYERRRGPMTMTTPTSFRQLKARLEYPFNFTLGGRNRGMDWGGDRDRIRDRSEDYRRDNYRDNYRRERRDNRRDSRPRRNRRDFREWRSGQGIPIQVPVSADAFSIKYPFRFRANGWDFEIPFTYDLLLGANDYRTVGDFTITDIEGQPWSLRRFEGSPVLVAFASSINEIQDLNALQRKYGEQGFQVIVFVDDELLSKEVRQYERSRRGILSQRDGLIIVEDTPSPFLAWLQRSRQFLHVNLSGDKFLIGRNGKVLHRYGPLNIGSYKRAIRKQLR